MSATVCGAGRHQFLAWLAREHGEHIAATLDADARGTGDGALDLRRDTARRQAVLQRRETVAVQRDVGVGESRVSVLPDHEDGLAMRHRAGADELHVGRQRDVAGKPLPGEVAGVVRAPDVGAAAGDAILAVRGVELQAAGLWRDAEIALQVEGIGCRLLCEGERGGAQKDDDSHCDISPVSVIRLRDG